MDPLLFASAEITTAKIAGKDCRTPAKTNVETFPLDLRTNQYMANAEALLAADDAETEDKYFITSKPDIFVCLFISTPMLYKCDIQEILLSIRE